MYTVYNKDSFMLIRFASIVVLLGIACGLELVGIHLELFVWFCIVVSILRLLLAGFAFICSTCNRDLSGFMYARSDNLFVRDPFGKVPLEQII